LKRQYPHIINSIFGTIGNIVENAKDCLIKKDFVKLGQLMNMNQGLLDSLGVGNAKLSSLIYTALESGSLGAKISGAGGGDCIIALTTPKIDTKIKDAIKSVGGTPIDIKFEPKGVIIK
jgi:mevalonate kinase